MNPLSSLPLRGSAAGRAPGRLGQSLGSVRPSQLLLAIPLFLALYATVLRSSIGTRSDILMGMPDLDHESYSRHRTMSERRTAEARPQQLAGPDIQAQGLAAPWKGPALMKGGPKIAFCATTSEPFKDIRHWLQWNRAIGVSRFYLFVQGRAGTAANVAALGCEPGVTVVPDDEELHAAHAASRIWNETWLSAFFHKPCNHELFVLQSLNMERAIQLAQRDGVDWLLHIDTDELVHPGGTRHFSLQEALAAVAPEVDVLVLPNHESLPERADVRDPFLEVTLFKRNYQHVHGELYSRNYAAVAHGNPNYFITYANGKSAARVQPGLRPNGAHRWNNYAKAVREEMSAATGVLHYTYNRLSDLKNRRDRCDCAPTEEDAKRCFILPFDRLAFLRASLLDDEGLARFFADHLLWNDTELVNDLINKGLFMRMHEPQVMIRGFTAAAGGEEAEEEEEGPARAAPARLEGVAPPLERLRPAFDGAADASTPPSPSPSPPAAPAATLATEPPQDRPPNPFVTLLQQQPPASSTEPAARATGSAAVAPPPPGPLAVTA